MDAFGGLDNFWDLSQHPSTFSSLPEDDFLALLQKQFPTNAFDLSPPDGIDPISISSLPIPNPTPPSTDSSPSPPSINQEPAMSRRQSGVFSNDSTPEASEDPSLKRKASDDDMDSSHKKSMSTSSAANRRRSTGDPKQDETRILKRKEQNRAAQRAFRERKEKHVKDLEDKLADLEAKNQQAESENGNLRDLLSRLQSENMALKQAAFTFSVPKPNSAASSFQQTQNTSFFTPGASTSAVLQQQPQPGSQFDVNFGSLIPFDPSSLSMLEEPTATDGAMSMDYSFNQPDGISSYKTIASNPMYMSFAEPSFDLSPSSMQTLGQSPGSSESAPTPMTTFDWNAPPTNSPPTSGIDSLDQLFGGFNSAQSPVDFSVLIRSSPSSVSPGPNVGLRSNSTSSSNSPASMNSVSASPVSNTSSNTSYGADSGECPKTKQECQARIAAAGPSPFVQAAPSTPQLPADSSSFFTAGNVLGAGANSAIAPAGDACPKLTREALLVSIKDSAEDTVGPNGGFVRKMSDGTSSMVMCKGSSFPKTEKSDRNIEVLTAWRSIMQNPQFKNVDINELCSEFTKKARCDGTKVVLEPEGVNDILESLAVKRA